MAQNIDFKKPEDGEVVLRMVNLAKERNIDYTPTHESCQSLHAYCLRKGIPPPPGVGGVDGPVPVYAPMPAPMDFAAMDQPPQNTTGQYTIPPPGMPPTDGMGGMPPGMGMPPTGGMGMPPADGGMGMGMPPAYQPNLYPDP